MADQDQDQPLHRVCVGKIASAHGIKGLVKILLLTDTSDFPEAVYTSENGPKMLEITIKNPLGKYVLAEIKGVTDRNAAEALGKCSLFVPRETMPSGPDHGDIIGKTAIDAAGTEIGIINSVENFGASDLLDIRLKSGKSVMVPLTPDFVPEIGERVMIVNYEAFL